MKEIRVLIRLQRRSALTLFQLNPTTCSCTSPRSHLVFQHMIFRLFGLRETQWKVVLCVCPLVATGRRCRSTTQTWNHNFPDQINRKYYSSVVWSKKSETKIRSKSSHLIFFRSADQRGAFFLHWTLKAELVLESCSYSSTLMLFYKDVCI